MRKKLKEFLYEKDSGATIGSFPMVIVLFMTLFFFVFNIMYISFVKHYAQLALDASSRAAVTAVDEDDVYYVRQRDGSYHVYTPLDEYQAVSNAYEVLNKYHSDMPAYIEIEGINPTYMPMGDSGYFFLDDGNIRSGAVQVWDSEELGYSNTGNFLRGTQQYEAGVFTIIADVFLGGLVGTDLIGLPDNVHFDNMLSQSSARGSVTIR